jgi:two-component sensor histidine kinase
LEVIARKLRIMESEADQQSFLLRLSDALRPLANLDAIEFTACRMLGEHLNVDYASSADLHGDEFVLRQSWFNDRPVEIQRGSVAAFSRNLAELNRRGETVAVSDVSTDARFTPEERGRILATGVGAFIRFMRVDPGGPVGTFAVYQHTRRAWTEAEIWLVHGVAQRVWTAIERDRAHATIRRSEEQLAAELADMQVLQRISGELVREQDPQRLFQTIVEAAALLMRSEAALMQEYDPQTQRLKLLAWRGLHPDAAAYWQWISVPRRTKWASTMRTGKRIVVADADRSTLPPKEKEMILLCGLRGVQSTPLISHSGRIVGALSTQWSHAHKPGAAAYRAFDVLARWAADLLVRVQIENDLRDSEARQKVLVAELQHRTRNIISVVQSIAERSAESASSLGDFLAGYNYRLSALSRVQSLLSRSEAEPITIGALVRMELDAIGFSAMSDRIRLSGPEVRLHSAVVQTLALALHELATNALKHGPLGRQTGTLDVVWQLREGRDRHLVLDWKERGLQLSPQQQEFTHRGHGVELIEEALPYTLGARTSLKLKESGVVCVIDLPLDKPRAAEP